MAVLATEEQTLAGVSAALQALADDEKAHHATRFFKTGPGQYGEGDRFLGIRVPDLRRIARQYRALNREDVLALLQSEWHEERLTALLIMVQQYRSGRAARREEIFHDYLANTRFINNWDLVDTSAEYIVGAHLDPADTALLERLSDSASVWERRIAMLSTFGWIKRGEHSPALQIAERLLRDEHDLIHKAVGWMLREVGNRDMEAEEGFLATHYPVMPRTMLRYAIERFPEDRRQAYLKGTV